jgi:hypothetical protein
MPHPGLLGERVGLDRQPQEVIHGTWLALSIPLGELEAAEEPDVLQ